MAKVKITELLPAGSELFQDSESFLDNLRDDELGSIRGGSNRSKYKLFLKILHRLTAVSDIRLTDETVQTAIRNSVNANTINRIDFVNESTINGRTLNGFSISNVNTAP